MNLKDESIYYFKRAFMQKKLQSKRDKPSYTEFYNHKCIFVHVPKTAGIAISKSFLGMTIAHLTALEYRMIYGKEAFDNCFKFSFVRNPFTRLVSAYEFMLSGGYKGYNHKDEPVVQLVKRYSSLEDFVLNHLTPKTAFELRHFRPQHHYVCDSSDRVMVDYLGRYESLVKDYEYIREKTGLGEPLQKHNVTKSNKLSIKDYYHNEEVIQKVRSIYKKDFEIFGYSKELPTA